MPTLLQYLVSPNPEINDKHSWSGTNTQSGVEPFKRYDTVEIWDEFRFETLKKMYGQLLNIHFDGNELPDFKRSLPFHLTEIRDEDSLNALLTRWTNAVVSTALKLSQSDSSTDTPRRNKTRSEIFMARGGQAHIPNSRRRPDWAGIKRDVMFNDEAKQRIAHVNLLPGDTKLSKKWNMASFEKNRKNPEAKRPIQQLLTYCVKAGTRYGYLITQDELVVFRVSQTEGTKTLQKVGTGQEGDRPQSPVFGTAQLKLSMKYRSISWKTDGESNPKDLTVNLALWWIHILAANKGSLESEYVDLISEYDTSMTVADSVASSFSSAKRSWQDNETPENSPSFSAQKRRRRRERASQDPSMSFDRQSSV